jgi:hypothetical protein
MEEEAVDLGGVEVPVLVIGAEEIARDVHQVEAPRHGQRMFVRECHPPIGREGRGGTKAPAQGLRERLTSEQWGLIRSMRESFTRALEAPGGELPTLSQVLPALDRLALQLAAVTGAQSGDVVVIAGKGHESGQIVGHTVLPFNDADEVRAVIGRTGKA